MSMEQERAREAARPRAAALSAGLGGVAFGALTVVALFVSNPPGGAYSAGDVADFLAHGHRAAGLTAMQLGLLAVLGLVCLLAQLRDSAGAAGGGRLGSVVWGAGLAAAACFAVGWGLIGGQLVAHLEGGSAITVPPALTYLLSEIGVVLLFGCGAPLLGLALLALAFGAPRALPAWLRWLTVVAGVCGLAGLAFFTTYLLMAWAVVAGAWLLLRAGAAAPAAAAVSSPR